MDIRLAMMCGSDIPIPPCKLVAHQPRIKEIALIGEQDFFIAMQCLCFNKSMFSQDQSVLDSISNFQIFMTMLSQDEDKEKKQSVLKTLQLLFPKYNIVFTPRALLFTIENDNIVIDEANFDELQVVLRQIFCVKDGPMDTQAFNPANKKAKEIADKLMRGRQRVAEQKGESTGSVLAQYLSILTIGIHSMSLQDLMSLTIFQLYDLIERYGLWTNWDLDVRTRLAGGKPENQPDNWMKNIH